MRNWPLNVQKQEFKEKYPNADITKFTFNADLNKSGNVIKVFITYMFNYEEGYDSTSNTFKTQYADALYWSPRIWSPSGTVKPLILTTNSLPYNATKFNIYVTKTCSFLSSFEKLNTSWQGNGKDITKVAVDRNDPYFASLLASIIISHKGRISKNI